MLPEELYLAIKYLSARKKSFFSALTLSIAVGGVALGVASLIITLSVMSGFQKEIRSKILGNNPHIIVFYPTDEAARRRISDEVSGVKKSYPFVLSQALVQGKAGNVGAVIKGVQNEKTEKLPADHAVIGKELARSIGASLGDEIMTYYSSRYEFGMMPRLHKLKVAGFLESGMYEYDSSMILVNIVSARKIFMLKDDESTGIGVEIFDPEKTELISRRILAVLPSAQIRSWQQMNRNLFEALKLEKIMMFIILALIVIVAAFNIVSNLTLFVSQKSKDIGILKSLGITKGGVSRIFVYIGSMLGSIGIALGVIAGVSVCYALKKYDIIKLPAEVYFISRLPVSVNFYDVLWTVSVSFLITMIATFYPSYRAGKLNPADILRYG